MSEEFGEDFLKLDFFNLLYDVINFNVWVNYLDVDSLVCMVDKLCLYFYVFVVYY